jgi:hypothetical protein
MIGYYKNQETRNAILGNVLILGDSATAYYILNPYNYSLMSQDSRERHISKLKSGIAALYSTFGEVKVSIFNLSTIVSKKRVLNKIIDTVQKWDPDYKKVPDEYASHVPNVYRDYSILAVHLETKNAIDIENDSLITIFKRLFDEFVEKNFSVSSSAVNETLVNSQQLKIANILQRYALPASSEIVMNIYVNSIFPSYNLVYNNYIMSHNEIILGTIEQTFIPHLGWFEMSNEGIVEFGGHARTTYGSIIRIYEMPPEIESSSFRIRMDGLRINHHLLPKDKAILKFKRMKADMKQEAEDAVKVDAPEDTNVNKSLSQVERALSDIRNNRIMDEVDANILVLADDKDTLDKRKKRIISILSDMKIVASISPNQAKDYRESFITGKPSSYVHIMDLEYALAFQQDDGVLVGDSDSNFMAPVIGMG